MPSIRVDEQAPSDANTQKGNEIRQIKGEISLLNLLNGLYLSREQLDQLIDLAEQATELRGQYLADAAPDLDDYIGELSLFRKALYSPSGATQEEKNRVFKWERRVEIMPRDMVAEKLGRIEERVRTVLSDGQIAIIEEFKPCLIPPKNLANPVAVGQASTTEREEAALDIIRRMPDRLYKERRLPIATMIVHSGEREKGKVPEDVKTQMIETYIRKMDEARRMSDVDFELNRRELAEEFRLFDDDVTYHKGHQRDLGKISRFLLSDVAAAVLPAYRDARAGDLPETHLPKVAEGDPTERRVALRAGTVMQYGRLTRELLNERQRMGRLNVNDRNRLLKTLGAIRDMESVEDQFYAVGAVADELNAITITKASVRSMMIRVLALSHVKRVPTPPAPQAARPMWLFQDITGLGTKVHKARECVQEDRIEEAYATLADVAACLADFKG